MSNDYTFVDDLSNYGGGQPMQGMPMMQMQGGGQPMQMQGGGDQFDMLQQYLAESANDSDSDSDDDEEDYSSGGGCGGNDWQHIYGILNLILIAIVLWYVYKIRKELVGMYEEA